MENISSAQTSITIQTSIALKLRPEHKSALTNVDQIQYLMLKLVITTFLQLQPKEESGSSNLQETVWNRKKDCSTVMR